MAQLRQALLETMLLTFTHSYIHTTNFKECLLYSRHLVANMTRIKTKAHHRHICKLNREWKWHGREVWADLGAEESRESQLT